MYFLKDLLAAFLGIDGSSHLASDDEMVGAGGHGLGRGGDAFLVAKGGACGTHAGNHKLRQKT